MPLNLTPEEKTALDAAVASLPRSLLDKLTKDAIVQGMAKFEQEAPKLVENALRDAIAARVSTVLENNFKEKIDEVVQAKAHQMVSRLKG